MLARLGRRLNRYRRILCGGIKERNLKARFALVLARTRKLYIKMRQIALIKGFRDPREGICGQSLSSSASFVCLESIDSKWSTVKLLRMQDMLVRHA
jgi:hypothetical protein